MLRDDLHFNFRTIDGYQKPFNFVLSEREAGKSTAVWCDKVYPAWKNNKSTSLIIRRQVVDITDIYINDIGEILRKFNPEDEINISYKNSAIKDGIIEVKLNEEPFVRIVGLSISVSRIKSLILRNLKFIVFDEFICNQRFGERYLKDEAFKFKECFNTFQRENPSLTCYFLGNPYSLYNPYFVDFGIPTRKLTRGSIFAGSNYVVQCYEIKKELKDLILKRNPLYKFDDSYTKYAFNGLNINDLNIRLGDKPQNYQLRNIIKLGEKYIGIWQNNYFDDLEDRFYCNIIKEIGSRKVYAFEFNDMVDRTIKYSAEDRFRFLNFKKAIERRQVTYDTIETSYLVEQIYDNI